MVYNRGMNLRIFVLGISFLTLISLVSLTFILTNINPYSTTILNFVLFYSSFFVAAVGLFILTGFYLRKLFVKKKIAYRLLKTSFRQGILVSIVLTGFLLLQSFRALNWWSGGIIIIVIIGIEIYFVKK